MANHEQPHGYQKMDTVAGTIVRVSYIGFEVALDGEESELASSARAFVHGWGEIGQRVLVSLGKFNERHGNFSARLDGVLDDRPNLAAAMAALAA